jgi:hypothetical protein
MGNQWPEFDKLPKPQTVRSVLLEEGNGIAERTNGEIRFVVEPELSGKSVAHHCSLFVSKVGYRYPLMRVIQDGFGYPVRVIADNIQQVAAGNEAELRKVLGQVFQSDAIKNVVPQLLELVS